MVINHLLDFIFCFIYTHLRLFQSQRSDISCLIIYLCLMVIRFCLFQGRLCCRVFRFLLQNSIIAIANCQRKIILRCFQAPFCLVITQVILVRFRACGRFRQVILFEFRRFHIQLQYFEGIGSIDLAIDILIHRLIQRKRLIGHIIYKLEAFLRAFPQKAVELRINLFQRAFHKRYAVRQIIGFCFQFIQIKFADKPQLIFCFALLIQLLLQFHILFHQFQIIFLAQYGNEVIFHARFQSKLCNRLAVAVLLHAGRCTESRRCYHIPAVIDPSLIIIIRGIEIAYTVPKVLFRFLQKFCGIRDVTQVRAVLFRLLQCRFICQFRQDIFLRLCSRLRGICAGIREQCCAEKSHRKCKSQRTFCLISNSTHIFYLHSGN